MKQEKMMATVFKINKSAQQGIRDVLKYLLQKKKVRAVLSLKKTLPGAVSYSLITEQGEIDNCVPLYPFMPVNAAGLLSLLVQKGPPAEPIAVILRPCELRAFIELVKLKQASLENIFTISITCAGVYPIKNILDKKIENDIETYKQAIKEAAIPPGLRPTCSACEHFLPYGADITISLIGRDIDKVCEIYLNTKKAKKFLGDFAADVSEGDMQTGAIKLLREKRILERDKLLSSFKTDKFGIDGLIDIYGKCLACYGCRGVCPICYCTLCFFNSKDNESAAYTYENEVTKRGAIRVPPGTILYHLGRISHVGMSCVGCGSCSDVCPVEIPLASILLKTSRAMQEIYEYIPGKNVDEEIPLQLFKEKELSEFEQ